MKKIFLVASISLLTSCAINKVNTNNGAGKALGALTHNFSLRDSVFHTWISALDSVITVSGDSEAVAIRNYVTPLLSLGYPVHNKKEWLPKSFFPIEHAKNQIIFILGLTSDSIAGYPSFLEDMFYSTETEGRSFPKWKNIPISLLVYETSRTNLGKALLLYHEDSHCYDYAHGLEGKKDLDRIDGEVRAYSRTAKVFKKVAGSEYEKILSDAITSKLKEEKKSSNEWSLPVLYKEQCKKLFGTELEIDCLATFFISYINQVYPQELQKKKLREFIVSHNFYNYGKHRN